MAFCYNPSKLVTDVLSKYLEFDPEQLQLGIWSGDLSIKNVQLKRDAIYPLLNDTSLPQKEGKPPLNLKLVSGSVGHMRIRIPWKRLVWGQGDVRLQISDVAIAVAYESREETAARRGVKEERTILQETDDGEEEDEKKREARERKQECLRQAERCQLQGLPIPDKPKVDPSAKEEATGKETSVALSAGTVDRWLKNIGDNFAWRFFAGLQASIRNVRVAIVQDGVEIGAIFHSMDVNAGQKDGSEKEAQEADPISDEGTGGITIATPPPDVIPEGEYDDGEHVDKMIKVQGFGVFIRREGKNSKIPPALKFSTSVTADDYLLRPTEGTLSFSFFYPHPADRKRKKIQQIPAEEPTTPTTATATVQSVTSSKTRRSKREKREIASEENPNEATSDTPGTERPTKQPRPERRVSLGLTPDIHSPADLLPISETPIAGNITEINQHQRSSPNLPRRPSAHHRRRTSGLPLLRADDASTMPPTPSERHPSTPKPRLDLNLSFGDVKTTFSSRHYELALLFNATVERVKNGRPRNTIASCFGEHEPDTMRSVYVDAPTAVAADVEGAMASHPQSAVPSYLTPSTESKRSSLFVDAITSPDEDFRESRRVPELPSDLLQSSVRPARLRRAQTTGHVDCQMPDEKPQRVQLHLQLQLPKVGAKHSGVVRSWWHYACSAVLFEVRQRRIERATFAGKDLHFDWERQSYRRKEYVELYIATQLEPSSVLRSVELKVLLTSRTAEEKLLNIEDELSVEQIILYRAIARSLRVRGMRKMPDSVRELHGDRWLVEASPVRHGSVTKSASPKPVVCPIASLDFVEKYPNDFDSIRGKVKAARRRRSIKDTSEIGKNAEKKQAADNTLKSSKSEVVAPPTNGSKTDGRTMRSFHTAKSKSKASKDAKKEVSPSDVLRVSVSVTFLNIEVMVYRDRQSCEGSVNSMRLRPTRSSGPLDSKIRSSGLQLVAGDASVSDFSDLSTLSDDQMFLGEDGDSSNLPEVESIGNNHIMSSTDFLFGLTGGDVLLRAVVSSLTIKTRGHSGGTKISSLTIDQVSVNSHDGRHLMSLIPHDNKPLDEVLIGKPRKSVKSTPSFGEMGIFQEQAVIVSLLWKRSGAQLQCDLSKVKATIDVEAASNLVDFFADVRVMSPQPVITPTPVDELRAYVLCRLAIRKGRWIVSSDSVSRALRIHGVELRIPCPDDSDSVSRKSSSASESSISRDEQAKVKISMNLVEYYDGSFVEDICALASDFSEDVSRMTEGMSDMGNVDWVRRHLNMLDVPELITAQLTTSSRHSVVALAGFSCYAETATASERGDSYDFFDEPVDVELLLTRNELYDFPSCHPDKQITVEVSPTRVVVSEARLDVLARVFSSMTTSERDVAPKTTGRVQPRLAALSSQVLVAFDLRLSDFRLTCVDDSACLQPSMSNKEIIIEESLTDFLSVFSCFHPEVQTKETLDVAHEICMDRLVVLGLSKETAYGCVDAARLNYIAGVEEMKHTQSLVLMELAESSRQNGESISSSSSTSSKDYKGDGVTGCAAYDTVPSVKEMPDDDSEESIDIIETTLKNAVERTMSSFGSLLENGAPEPRAFSDFLVISLPDGASLSMTKMFYDFRLEVRFRSSSVRNASGTHLLAMTPPPSSTDDKDPNFASTGPGFPAEYFSDGSDAVSFSFFELDSEYDFGEGGLPLAILGSHEDTEEPRQREQLNNLVLGEIKLFFAQEIFDQAIQSVTRLLRVGQDQPDISDQGANSAENPAEMQYTIYAVISSVTLILASDELAPFCRMKVENCTIDNVFQVDASVKRSCVNFEAKTCHVLDLTPEGIGFPEILFPLISEIELATDLPASFRVQFLPSKDKWSEPSNLFVEMHGVRLFLVRRFVNELLQYCASGNYGVGLLVSKSTGQPQYDVNGNPPPPTQYHITVTDSSIILPRCSTSTDVVAIEVEKFTVFTGFAVSSFTLPTDSSQLNVVENVVYKGTSAAQSLSHGRSSLSTSDVEFFDCIDQADAFGSAGPLRVSSFKKEWIKRTTVLLEHMRIFTSLPRAAFSRGSDCAVVHKFYRISRRASENGPVYTRYHSPAADRCDEPARRWREISSSECSLEIVADYAPHLRLLITDRVIRRESRSDTLPINLDMRMSELCLLLSIWYSNMQELPLMFPYSPLAVSSAARLAQPSVEVPEYGSGPYVERLKCPSKMKSEIAIVSDAITIRGSFDDPGYFSEEPQILRRYASRNAVDDERLSIDSLAFMVAYEDCVLHITTDIDGILRLALGASRCNLVDERRGKSFESVLVAGERNGESDRRSAWADQSWGLDCNGCTLSGFLPQSHQVTVFMTPGWCLINLGIERADVILADLSPIWVTLDYFASYFKSGSYGNPAFEAAERKAGLKRVLGRDRVNDNGIQKQVSLNVDFRLWLLHPCICIPQSAEISAGPSLSIGCSTGFWYHYRSIGTYSLQEMGSTDLSLTFSEDFLSPDVCRSGTAERNDRVLIDGLSFGLRMNSNAESQHADYFFRMPFFEPHVHDATMMCNVISPELETKRIALSAPSVCTPFVQPTRTLGSSVCEFTILLEVLPVASSLLLNLITGPSDLPATTDDGIELSRSNAEEEKTTTDEPSFALVAHVDSLRIFAIDPVLELHLPVALACLSPLDINVSQLRANRGAETAMTSGEAFRDDFQVSIKSLIWADYFKLGVTRSWEPLLEPFSYLALYERSKRRGHGLSFHSYDEFHVNITDALLTTLDESISSFSRLISETFGTKDASMTQGEEEVRFASAEEVTGATVADQLHTPTGSALSVLHQIPTPFPIGSRIAFSFRNLTGQQIRIHQLSRSMITYLDHLQSTTLSFDATISVANNLSIIEVPFPGLPNSHRAGRGGSSVNHEVDVQLPGFRWLEGITVNTSGRKFDSLVPRSSAVLSKVQRDWRLANAMKILTEVGLENGGRLIAARSIFDIRNNTSHHISLILHPSPTSYPAHVTDDDRPECIEPGAVFHIPSLLLESSLRLEGNHLGSFWIRPDESKDNKDLSYLVEQCEGDGTNTSFVGFCSRPIQLAKLVHETSLIFQGNNGEDLEPKKARSGVQVSCPVSVSTEGIYLAPFCYVIDIRRSPVIKSRAHSNFEESKETGKALLPKRRRHSTFVHGPVSYSLRICPPLIIENLLPRRGRFELMHATFRTIVWFADLKPGERVPIHTVGLDAPLRLMLNLGFCRTPIGEGALVHHGSDARLAKGIHSMPYGSGLKSIGKAVTKGTKQVGLNSIGKQVGKTLTTIAESPDKRGQGKFFLIKNPQFSSLRSSDNRKKGQSHVHVPVAGGALGLDTGGSTGDGKVYGIEHEAFAPSDVQSVTEVVDSVGQRLILNIENVRGGGGQRRISVYCPYWIINTTEYALMYKQEKGSSFVSGTVVSPAKDGSQPVDGSDRNVAVSRRGAQKPVSSQGRANREGVFAGTPGALATSPGQSLLSPDAIISLLDRDIPLDKLTKVAFMFNFQDEMLSMGIRELCVQLSDGTGRSRYSSAWSQGFSLDTVGVNQVVSMHCKDGRALEISVTLGVAPGFLSGYTKLVRFAPRFVLVNHLERPIRIWQDSSLLHPMFEDRPAPGSELKGSKWHFKCEHDLLDVVNQYDNLFGGSAVLLEDSVVGMTGGTTAHKAALYIATAGTSDIVPFHLPDTRSDRQLRIDLGGSWNLTSSFSADSTGEYTFKITRAFDLRMLNHVTTRASPLYKVVLPPEHGDDSEPWDGELGVWFETDWGGDRRIIVKGTKRGSYSFNHTDIHAGDELLRIDDVNVSQMTFSETMKILKERIADVSLDRKGDKCKRSLILMNPLRRSFHGATADVGIPVSSNSLRTGTKVILTFRTLEERLRRVRVKALHARRVRAAKQHDTSQSDEITMLRDVESGERSPRSGKAAHGDDAQQSPTAVKVEMRLLHHSFFLVVRPPDPKNPPFRIENRALEHIVYFRQRGCNSYPWNQVKPGESVPYSWEEPMRARKLTVRVGQSAIRHRKCAGGADIKCKTSIYGDVEDTKHLEGEMGVEEKKNVRAERLKQLLSIRIVNDEEHGGLGASRSIKLEVIGFKDTLPCPKDTNVAGADSSSENYLICQVDTDGLSRVLIISDRANEDERTEMQNHLSVLERQIREEEERKARILELGSLFNGGGPSSVRSGDVFAVKDDEETKSEVLSLSQDEMGTGTQHPSGSAIGPDNPTDSRARTLIENELEDLADFPEDISITRCHQVLVEIIEAAGLRSNDANGVCNPYCEIMEKNVATSGKSFRSRPTRKTYFVKNTTSPKWTDQVFIFPVPAEAAHMTRGLGAKVRVRNFHWIGNHPSLGHTTVHLSSLRNQQEIVGWYPLVRRAVQGDLDDSLTNYGRGSVKIRIQWIHSVPGLVDYFLMLSERRLINLRQSVDGMKKQLIHAMMETKRERKRQNGPLVSFRTPRTRGRRKTIMSSRNFRMTSGEDYNVIASRTAKPLGSSDSSSFHDSLRYSREKHLWQLHFQTEESRKSRRRLLQDGSTVKSDGSLVDETAMKKTEIQSKLNDGFTRDDGTTPHKGSSFGPLYHDDDTPGNFVVAGDVFAHFGGASSQALTSRRARAFTEPDSRSPSDRRIMFWDDSRLLDRDGVKFSRLARASEFEDSDVDVTNSFSFADLSDAEDQAHPLDTTEALLEHGFIHHKGDTYLHRDHLSYHLRNLLVVPSVGNERGIPQSFRAKSTLRLSPLIREFKSWTAAQAIFNDDELETQVVDTGFRVTLKMAPEPTKTEAEEKLELVDDDDQQCSAIAEQLRLPHFVPSAMLVRANNLADSLANSRRQFERACKRSLAVLLNPGGWLTIRPMTALHLPETWAGMFVRLRYGKETFSSKTVDAKVSPTWTVDTTVQVTPYAHTISLLNPRTNALEYGESDLQIYVEPQMTSGSLRLSVFGERFNKKKVELGVLHIPLGDAISCCMECIEDVSEDIEELHPSLRSTAVPVYVRWFPLMNPEETVAVDGDMGLSSRPPESEKLRDNMFAQYFTPCIKLALIWQPDEARGGGVVSKQLPASDQYSKVLDGSLPDSPASLVTETYFNVDIGRVSAALIDSQRAMELVSVTITDVDVRHSVTKSKTRTGLFISWLQIDYQGDKARESVVLAPTPGEYAQPTLGFLAVKDNLRTKSNIESYEYVWIALHEMDLTLEESWMFELWEFFVSIIRRKTIRSKTTFADNVVSSSHSHRDAEWSVRPRMAPRGSLMLEHNVTPTLSVLLEDDESADYENSKKVYIEQLLLGFVKVNLSYRKGKKASWDATDSVGFVQKDKEGAVQSMTNIRISPGGKIFGRESADSVSPMFERWSEQTQDEDIWTEAEDKYSNYPHAIASVFPSVSDAPIRLQAKVLEHVFESPNEVINSIKNYYLNEILKQIYKIIGSLDFVGNPSQLLRSFATGVRDFFVTPSEALLRSPNNPSGVGVGVAKGTLSLFSHSASGIFGFFSKISALAGQVAATLSLDEDFQRWHMDVVVAEAKGLSRQWKRRGVQSLPKMVARPVYDIVNGVVLGLAGPVYRPCVGAKRGGWRGFVKGVASGAVGLIAKPVAGVCDSCSHFSGSIHDLAKSVNLLEKRYEPPRKLRLPHAFGPKSVLMPYNQVTAQSTSLLKAYPIKVKQGGSDRSVTISNEIHVASEVLPMEPGVQTYVVVSSHRIAVFQVKRESGGVLATILCWEVDLTRTSSVSSRLQDQGHNGVAVIISTSVPKKKTKIVNFKPVQFSPGRNVPMSDIEGTPLPSAPLGVSQSSFNETPASVPSLGDGAEEELVMSEGLGTKPSCIWEETEDVRAFMEDVRAFMNGHDGVQEFPAKNNFCGSLKGRDGEILEWFSILAEFPQRGQLTRIHNAICCVIGDFQNIIDNRGTNRKGSTEGYTSFGELYFGRDRAREAVSETPHFDEAVCGALDHLLWMHESQFQKFKLEPPEKQQVLMEEMKNSWVLSREVSATLERGLPMWIVDARAKATFVPHAPPPLPDGLDEGDEVVSEIYTQLEEGNISYDQALHLIASHSTSVMAASKLDSSGLSTISDLKDLALDRLFGEDADDDDYVGLDQFFSMKSDHADRSPSELTHLDAFDRSVQSQAASVPGDFIASRSSPPYRDASESSELQSLAERSIELEGAFIEKDKDNVSTSSSKVANEEAHREQLFQRTATAPLSFRTIESRPYGLPTEKNRNHSPLVNHEVDEWTTHDKAPADTKLDRLEAMLEQLLIISARQAAQQNVQFQPPGRKEDPEMMMLRQEIEELRAQVQSKVTSNDREEMIVALRKEVSSLKQQLNEKDQKLNTSKVNKTGDQVEESPPATTGSLGRKLREQLLKPSLELKLKQQSSAKRKRQVARDMDMTSLPSALPVLEEEEGNNQRELGSV